MQENSMLLDSCAKCFHSVRFCCFSCKLLSKHLTHLSFTISMTSHENDMIQQNEKKDEKICLILDFFFIFVAN